MTINKSEIKFVFFDIDDTLYVKDKNYVPESAILAIRKLKQNGIIPAIATGRTRCGFPAQVDQLIQQENIELIISINGQCVEYQGKMIEKHSIEKEKIDQLVQLFRQQGIDYGFVAHEAVAVSQRSAKLCDALNPILTSYIVDKDYYLTQDVQQLLCFYDPSQDPLLENNHLMEGLKVIRWHQNAVDILNEESSKARGIARAVKLLGYSMDNVMAFGDGLNDLEMLSEVAVGVAMGNSHPQLKAQAKYVTEHIEQNGIYHFLAENGLIS